MSPLNWPKLATIRNQYLLVNSVLQKAAWDEIILVLISFRLLLSGIHTYHSRSHPTNLHSHCINHRHNEAVCSGCCCRWIDQVDMSAVQLHTSHYATGISCHQHLHNKLCGRPPQYATAPVQVDLWPWKWCPSHVWRGCYLCANLSLPRPLCSRLRLYVRDRRQTSDAHHRLMLPPMVTKA